MQLTDAGDHDDMAVFPVSHNGQDGLDDVDVGEEIDLKNLIHQAYSPTALCQLFDSTNNSFRTHQSAETQHLQKRDVPSLAAHKSTSMRPNASTASATAD
jgi:hypothetical protein